MSDLTRRNVLAAGTLGVAGAALAGCSSGEEASPTPQPSSPPSATPAESGAALIAATDVPLEGGVIIESGQTKVVITQPQPNEYVGLSAVCPHQGCLVNQVADSLITCPCHGSEFSITDGSVVQGPAQTGLTSVPVKLDGDQIVLA
ncbi:MAG: Rieske (2Fe-2S) protein [Micrococcales bacterium]|nr:Rieske (2Fe-2S) protein [Micrococcales bacterium]